MPGFALWATVASPVEDDAFGAPKHILQVKAYITKNEGVGIGFYLFEQGSTSDDEHMGGSAYFDLNRNAFEGYYSAILSSLDYINEHHGIKSVTVQCDHDMVVHQLNGKFEIQRESLRTLYWEVMKMKEERFDQVDFEFIPPNKNKQAGDFANKALGSKTLMNYHFDMNDPMLTMVDQAAGATRTQKSTKGSRLKKNSKLSAFLEEDAALDEEEIPFDECEASILLEEMVARKQPKKVASDEIREAVFGAMPEATSAPSPSTAAPVRPGISPDHLYVLEFDGGTRGNPTGVAGCGMVLYDTGPDKNKKHEVWAGWDYLGRGKMTNNQAEYSGLIAGLEAALARGVRKIAIYGDSELVIKHLSGEYQVRNEKLKPLWKKTKDLLKKFDSYEMRHIYRHLNGRADGLANLAMDNQDSGSSD